MTLTQGLLALAVLLAAALQSDASVVVFKASQDVIHPILTQSFSLRCSVQDNAPLWSTTFRPWLGASSTPSSSATTAKNDVSDSGISHVTAIIITKENKVTGQRDKVASLTPFDGAIDESTTPGRFKVEGSSHQSPLAGEQGYLQLTWARPVEEQAGIYFCEVFALNLDKHPISLWTSVEITSTEPSLSDLVNQISEHSRLITELMEENTRLKDDVLLTSMNETQNETRVHAFLSGSVSSCTSNNQYIYFPESLPTIPKIMTTVWYHRVNSNSGYYRINVHSVSHSGFYIFCDTYYTDLSVDWFAFY